jgi:hypothetical protein
LVDKTDNSTTDIYCYTSVEVYSPDAFLQLEQDIDDEAEVSVTASGDYRVSLTICDGLANSTDDDVVEPSTEVVGGTI